MLSTTETDLDRAEDAGYPGSVKSFEIIDPSRTLSYRVCLCSAVSSKRILSIIKIKSNPFGLVIQTNGHGFGFM